MDVKHSLTNKELNKVFNIELSSLKVVYQTGKVDKLRTYKKEFKSKEESLIFFDKKEWEMLKKGFVFNDENAKIGNPKMHYFTSRGYSGCLSFVNTPKGIFVYQHGSYDVPEPYDLIVHIDKEGNLIDTLKLPSLLPWDMQYNPKMNSLLLDLDHHIYSYDVDNQNFNKIAPRGKGEWGSFVSVSESLYSYGTNEKLIVKDFEDNTLFSKDYKLKIIKGSIPFSATLSKTKNIIAVHTKVGEISLFDIKENKELETIKGNFDAVTKMEFVDYDNILVIKEYYHRKLQFFDLNNKSFVEFPNLDIPGYSQDVGDFCFNKNQTKLALIQETMAYIFDFKNKKLLNKLKIKHCVKRAEIKFIDEDLGVRTDYGCFSLYKV